MSSQGFSTRAIGIIVAVCSIASLPANVLAQNPPGRLLTTPGNNNIIECNLDASNCFFIEAYNEGNISFSSGQSPSVARDGTIAFIGTVYADGTCTGPCNPHVFIMNADGTNPRQLTFTSNTTSYNGEINATISPDASTVAFLSNLNTVVFANGSAQPQQIYLVNADGSNLRQLTPFAGGPDPSQGYVDGLAWSPDSRTMAFRAVVYTTFCNPPGSVDPIYTRVIGSIGTDGNNAQILECDGGDGYVTALDWSPNGTLLAWTRNVDHGAQGCSGCVGEPAIAFHSFSGPNPPGLTSTQLNTDGCQGGPHCIHFSPDSTQLAYMLAYPGNGNPCSPSQPSPTCTINIINLDGTNRLDTTVPIQGAGFWWMPGPAIPAAAQITLEPAILEFWPGFSRQLVPSLRDGNGNLILHTAQVFTPQFIYAQMCQAQIGPYGQMMSTIYPGNFVTPSYVNASNSGLTSASVPFYCWPSQPCTYGLAFNSANFGSSGGSDSVGVLADHGQTTSACPWNATSSAPWITITSPAYGEGAGNTSIEFTVAANAGAQRQGTISIAPGMTFTVTQDAFNTVTLQSIAVTPSPASVAAGLTLQFTATGQYSDSTTKDLTATASWSSSNTGLAAISNAAGSTGLATGVAQGGPITITATLNGVSGTAPLTVTAPALQSIVVAPSTASVPAGFTQQFTATGHYSDSSTQDLTATASWSSSNTGLATISNVAGSNGLASGVAQGGPVTITAMLNGVSGTAQLTITAPVLQSIAVTPANPSVPAGSTQAFTATGSYSDGSKQNLTSSVTWQSSSTGVATINTTGVATAVTAGTTTITAQQGGISGVTMMTVVTLQSITIAPLAASTFVGSAVQYSAMGHYSDGSARDVTGAATWTSSRISVATITSPGGLATAMAKGTTNITAKVGTFSATTSLMVSAVVVQSISVTPANASIAIRGTQQYTATATYNNGKVADVTNQVSWATSPKNLASITATGLATGLKAGTDIIMAKLGGVVGTATLIIQ